MPQLSNDNRPAEFDAAWCATFLACALLLRLRPTLPPVRRGSGQLNRAQGAGELAQVSPGCVAVPLGSACSCAASSSDRPRL